MTSYKHPAPDLAPYRLRSAHACAVCDTCVRADYRLPDGVAEPDEAWLRSLRADWRWTPQTTPGGMLVVDAGHATARSYQGSACGYIVPRFDSGNRSMIDQYYGLIAGRSDSSDLDLRITSFSTERLLASPLIHEAPAVSGDAPPIRLVAGPAAARFWLLQGRMPTHSEQYTYWWNGGPDVGRLFLDLIDARTEAIRG